VVDQAVQTAGDFGADVVIGLGGGSVIDAGKAIAALLANGGQTLDYLEGVGRGKELTRPSLPFIAAPTTAGTGSEATKNAVITDSAHTFKKSLRSDWMLPAVALVDPELTYGCPAAVAAACGMDAMTQLIEALTSARSNPLIDTLAGLGLGMASNLPKLFSPARNTGTYEALSMASLLGGIALANAGLGAAHGLASPLGAFFPIPHGVVCAILLPPVIAANARRAVQEGNAILLEKYAAVAIQLIETHQGEGIPEIPFEDSPKRPGEEKNKALDVALSLASFLKALNGHMGIPGLGAYGITAKDFPRIIAGGRGGSMKTNPVTLEDEELAQVLAEAL
jgi:alcohol dehydrogenase class IV